MAKLVKLSLCGVRSFGPDQEESVKFSSPLTLFLGQNGSGKTTVIESIKCALTGELPGGSRSGQGFINDPKISNKQTTKAAIKIKYIDAKGNEIVVARFMQVVQKNAKELTFKNLLPNIRFTPHENPGEVQDITGRCVDVDAYIAQSLNVSKSILNNVIFCHQENSLWPLDESSKLKGKFDEIFDAVKYNKCSENLRKMLKDKRTEINKLETELKCKKQLNESANSLRQKLEDRKDRNETLIKQINKKQEELNPLQKRITEILAIEDQLARLQAELRGKEEEKKGLQEQQKTIRKNITEIFQGSDEQLLEEIKSFQQKKEQEEKTVMDLEKRASDKEKQIREINAMMQKNQIKIGQLNEEKRQFEIRCQDRKDLINRARIKFELLNVNYNEESVYCDTIITDLKSKQEIFQSTFDSLILEKENEEKQLQTVIDQNRENLVSAQQKLRTQISSIAEYETKLKDVNGKIQSANVYDKQIKIITDKLRNIEDNITKMQSTFKEDEVSNEIEKLSDDIQKKEDLLTKVDREYRILQQNHVAEERIDSEKEMINEKQLLEMEIKLKHEQNLNDLFPDGIPQKNVRATVCALLAAEERGFKSISDKVNNIQKEVTTLETTIKLEEHNLENMKKELENDEKKVNCLTKGEPFTDVLNTSYTKKEKYQKDKGQYSSAKIMFETFIKEFESDSPCCPVCETNFANKKAITKQIIIQLKNKIENIPKQLKLVEKQLKEEENLYNKLQQLKPTNDNLEILNNVKLPLLTEELNNKISDLSKLRKQLATLQNEKKKHEDTIQKCRQVIPDVTLIDQYRIDMEKGNSNIEDLLKTIVTVESNRSRQEAESEIDSLRAQIDELKGRYNSKKKLLDSYKLRLQNTMTQKQTSLEKLNEYQKSVQERPLHESQKIEFSEQISNLKKDINSLKQTVEDLQQELNMSVTNKQTAVIKNKKCIQEERNKIDEYKKIIEDVQRIQNLINQYKTNNNEARMQKAVEDLKNFQVQEKNVTQEKNNFLNDIAEKKQNFAKGEIIFRSLKDNQTIREKQKSEEKLEQVINELKSLIGERNYQSVYLEKQQLIEKRELLSTEINSIKGNQLEIHRTIEELEKDLRKPENKNAFNEYKSKHYEFRIAELMEKDMWKFVLAFEKSILRFHKERMVQINRTIRELWRSIYRGNDIDYIEIQTEDSPSSNKQRRAYNYKVMQVKKGIELEMRGRCSAGQKVLACLVIRMALAETFSAHCGIMSLDEPTTNLDHDNIISLSEALSKIITSREREKNFQLIIITHDEEFLQTLTRCQSVSHYWKVSRNEEGFSQIEKQLL